MIGFISFADFGKSPKFAIKLNQRGQVILSSCPVIPNDAFGELNADAVENENDKKKENEEE